MKINKLKYPLLAEAKYYRDSRQYKYNNNTQMKKDEKTLLNEVEKYRLSDESDPKFLLECYRQLVNTKPYNSTYWSNYIEFIFKYYESFDIEQCDKLLEKAVRACQLARKNLETDKHALFYLYEYKLMIELIRFEPSYTEKYTEAKLEKTISQAVILAPYNIEAHHERGNFFSAIGEMDKANEEYKISTELRGKENFDLLLYTNKASNNEQNENYKEAISDYEMILQNINNKYLIFMTYQALLRIYKKLDNKEKVKYYKDLIEGLE